MGLIAIDDGKCTQCGLCARACPAGIIVLGDGFPETIEKIEKGCITCGHCVAVCPTAALNHCRMTPRSAPPLPLTGGSLRIGWSSLSRGVVQ